MKLLSSIPNLYNFQRDGVSLDNLLKRYALLCDHVVFNRLGAPIGDDVFRTLPEFIASFARTKDVKLSPAELGKDKRFAEIFIDMWDYVDDAHKLESNRYSFVDPETADSIGSFAFAEVRRLNGLGDNSYSFNIDEVKEIAGDLQADIALNEYAAQNGLGTFPSYAQFVGRALQRDVEINKGAVTQIFDEPLVFPDLNLISWNDILELRSDHSIISFRSTVRDQMKSAAHDHREIIRKLCDDTWKVIEEVQPRVGRSLLIALASNLPSPVMINPLGAAASAADVLNERRRKKEYAHVFFVQNLRSMASKN